MQSRIIGVSFIKDKSYWDHSPDKALFYFSHLKSHCEFISCLKSFYIIPRLSLQKLDLHWGRPLQVKIKQGELFFTQKAHSFIHSFIHSSVTIF